MKDLNKIASELFAKLRGKFKEITIGNEAGDITNLPEEGRFYEFTFNGKKVSVSLDEENVAVMYSEKLFDDDEGATKKSWYDFLKELREFARKRLLNFDTRNIQKTNLDRRDYKFLAKNNTSGEDTMTESKLYGTSKVSYQDVDNAKIVIKHTESVGENRNIKIGSIYIESSNGERFKYPFRHINGARAMARHVSEGGNPYDDFGKHIVGLSEELNKLRKFKTYMSRSGVMAEGLAQYMDIVNERLDSVKDTIFKLQRTSAYKEAFESFESKVLEEVPADVAGDWIDQLTIRQFNEELKDVFPYIYRLVSEATAVKELGPDELVAEASNEEVDGEITKDSVKKSALELLVDIAKTSKQYKGEVTDDQVHYLGSLVHDFDMAGIETEKYSEIEKLFRTASKTNKADMSMIQPAYAQAKTLDEGGMKDQLIDAMEKIASDTSGQLLYKALSKGSMGPDVQNCLQDMYDEVARDNGWHPDDDHDEIEQRMWDEINDEYGMGEGIPTTDDIEAAFDKSMGQFSDKEIPVTIGKDGSMAKINPDDEDEKPEPTVSLPEKILSLFDREKGMFPKGETAILTMVEKDYGEEHIEPAKDFIERIKAKYEEVMIPMEPVEDEGDMQIEFKTDTKDKEDLDAKQKELERIKRDKNTHKDPELKTALMKRQAELNKDKEAMAAMETLKSLAGI